MRMVAIFAFLFMSSNAAHAQAPAWMQKLWMGKGRYHAKENCYGKFRHVFWERDACMRGIELAEEQWDESTGTFKKVESSCLEAYGMPTTMPPSYDSAEARSQERVRKYSQSIVKKKIAAGTDAARCLRDSESSSGDHGPYDPRIEGQKEKFFESIERLARCATACQLAACVYFREKKHVDLSVPGAPLCDVNLYQRRSRSR